MKGKQTALMPGNGDKVGYWLTPPEVYDPLLKEFDFNFDPCPYPRPAGFDGLREEWGERNWVNPPFVGSLSPWTNKAIEEAKKGRLVVIILPISHWLGKLLEAGAETRYVGPVSWVAPDGRRRKAGYRHALFIFRPRSP